MQIIPQKIKDLPASWYKEKGALALLLLAASVSTNQVAITLEVFIGDKTISYMLALVMELSLFFTMNAIAVQYVKNELDPLKTGKTAKKENVPSISHVDKELAKSRKWFGKTNYIGNVFASFHYQTNSDNFLVSLDWSALLYPFEVFVNKPEFYEFQGFFTTLIKILLTFFFWGGVTKTITHTSTLLGVFKLQTKNHVANEAKSTPAPTQPPAPQLPVAIPLDNETIEKLATLKDAQTNLITDMSGVKETLKRVEKSIEDYM